MALRRTIVAGLGAAFAAAGLGVGLGAPGLAAAQPAKLVRIGVLLFGTPTNEPNFDGMVAGLRELGWVEGRTITFEHRYAEGRPERLRALAFALVATRPDLILAFGGDVVPFAREAAGGSIPIVMMTSADPVASGIVASYRRPGGNITGVAFVSQETAAKRLQFLTQAVPAARRVGVLWNPEHFDGEYRDVSEAGRRLGVQALSLEVRSPDELAGAFDEATRDRAESLMVVSSRLLNLNGPRVLDFASRQRLPLVSGWGEWAKAGALLSYGPDLSRLARRAAAQVDKVLRGASPAELPVEQPTEFQLIVNVKTAHQLRLALPPSLLAQADRIIE